MCAREPCEVGGCAIRANARLFGQDHALAVVPGLLGFRSPADTPMNAMRQIARRQNMFAAVRCRTVLVFSRLSERLYLKTTVSVNPGSLARPARFLVNLAEEL